MSTALDRDAMLARVRAASTPWDIVIIGGGATGCGAALDAASRGYSTLLLERGDFAHGTSSRSTKLIHGGVRYLQQGNVALVYEALHERTILRRNAPHLVHDLPFVVPVYDWWEAPFYGVGLKLYDLLAGRHGFGKSHHLSFDETVERLPTIERRGLRGGVVYHDGQFDDARLVLEIAKTAAAHGAVLVNRLPVVGFVTRGGDVAGVVARDDENGTEMEIAARVVVNAAGPYSDHVLHLEDAASPAMIQPSQGIHLVLDPSFLPGDSAIMVPHTDDGRVLFVIPWKGRVLLGTTDTPVTEIPLEPKPFAEEIAFLLEHAARYLRRHPTPADVLSAFAGLRPLVRSGGHASTAAVSRDHTVHVSSRGLVTVAGGKWTTFRKMAEDAVDHAALVGELPERACRTKDLAIGDASRPADAPGAAAAVRTEMARTVEDYLSRRTRELLLDARGSLARAPLVAREMARELGRDAAWEKAQVNDYERRVRDHLAA